MLGGPCCGVAVTCNCRGRGCNTQLQCGGGGCRPCTSIVPALPRKMDLGKSGPWFARSQEIAQASKWVVVVEGVCHLLMPAPHPLPKTGVFGLVV